MPKVHTASANGELQEFLTHVKAKMHPSPRPEAWLTEVRGLKFFLQTTEEIYILREIFEKDGYEPSFDQTSFAALDIGMNVGFVSLYYASMENCKNVYGYELFPQTYQAAQQNIELNHEISSKLKPTAKGLSKEPSKMQLPYSAEAKGQMGLYGLNNQVKDNQDLRLAKVETLAVSDEIQKFVDETKGLKRLAKIDCEGAEYEILESMAELNLLKHFDEYIIEWHGIERNNKKQSYKDLVPIFESAGFKTIEPIFQKHLSGEINHGVGMLRVSK